MSEMKKEVITILLVILAVLFAGCTGPGTQPLSEQVPETITAGSTTPVMTTVRQMAPTIVAETTTNTVPVRIFNGNYRWVEYRDTISVTMPPNPRSSWEYNIRMERSTGKFKDISAIHYKITTISDYPELVGNSVTVTKDGSFSIEDSYYDTVTNRLLEETWSERIKGVSKPSKDFTASYKNHSREDSPDGSLGITPFGEMNITLTDIGTEPVMVPAGTYPAARKYTGSFRDGTPVTFWVASGVPVPVQYQFPNKYLDGDDPFQSYELKGWG
jgi:hypothetical protein